MDRKTLLIVDDDPSCTRFLLSKVHEETHLVAIGAENLRQAVSLIEDTRVRIDAILADVHFEMGAADPCRGIADGIDLLNLAHHHRPTTRLYILSYFHDHHEYRAKARTLSVPIREWYQKLIYTGRQNDSPWKAIARDLLGSDIVYPSVTTREYSLFGFDVFLAHNSAQKATVERIARDLENQGLHPWLDKWHIPPGRTFQDAIAEAIEQTRSVAVFISDDGVGPWQDLEQKAAISHFVKRHVPVIPVFLYCALDTADVPLFLREFNSVFFRDDIPYAESLASLVWGVKGHKED